MARLSDIDPALAQRILALECEAFPETPWAEGAPLAARRVAIVSTAGLGRRSDARFAPGSADYRVIPGDTPADDLVMSHISVNYDRSGFQQDLNVVFPLDRLRDLAADGAIGSVAAFHYSLMGATDPKLMAPQAEAMAGMLKADRVDAVLLVPV